MSPPRFNSGKPLVVIPARDEADTVGPIVRQVISLGFDVVVIDDGSRDPTAGCALAAGAFVLQPVLKQGAWGAIQTGLRYAVRKGYDGVVTLDADGQHDPAYLPDLLAHAATADVVIGAYPGRGGALRKFAHLYFQTLTRFRIGDLTSGFRYYSPAACRALEDDVATLFDYQDIGVLLLLRHAGLRIEEVPVLMRQRQRGVSRLFSSGWAVVRYMAETTLLCMAQWGYAGKTPVRD